MRKVLISLAAAASAVAVAAPASAQVYGNLGVGIGVPGYGAPAYGYGYGAPAYGYNNVGRWQQQLQQVRYDMYNLSRQGRLTRSEANDLDRDIRSAERSLYNAGYRGISPWEARSMDEKIARLRYEVRRYADYDGRRGWNRGGYGNYYGDRDWDHDRR
jgi:hypothetical protein